MLSNQFETGCGMIEILHPFDLVKGYLRMTFRTVLSEPVFMHIPVACRAIAVGHSPEGLPFFPVAGFGFVAPGAVDFPVGSLQRKVAPVMIETRS